MFSGIIENTAIVEKAEKIGSNLQLKLSSNIANEFKVDQSISHNGVCLTVEEINGNSYQVTAIAETLAKTNIGNLNAGMKVNIERSITLQSRLDGHLVQGHVDAVATCSDIKDESGSYLITFDYPESHAHLIVEKGSITLNGTSLTVFNCGTKNFSVAIIPYTWEHTNFHQLKPGDKVNVEFDILGKYVSRWMEVYNK